MRIRPLLSPVRAPLWLALATAMVLGAITGPAVRGTVHLDTQPPPVESGFLCWFRSVPPFDGPAPRSQPHPPQLTLPASLALAQYTETSPAAGRVVARVICTGYSSSVGQTDSTPDMTASNKRLRPGFIALSRDLLARFTPDAPFHFGDRIELAGIGIFQVEDTMHPRWHRRADIWFPSQAAADAWGRRPVLLARPLEEPEDVALVLSRDPGGL